MSRRARGLLTACLALAVPAALAAQAPTPRPASEWGSGPGGDGPPVFRHEPIFGVGPHTTWKGGWGLEMELESESGEQTIPVELLYGITERLTMTVALPFSTPGAGSGVGDLGLRAKWRFATTFDREGSNALAVLGGVTIPRVGVVGVRKGGPTAMLGLAAGRESRRWYFFAGARGIVRTSDNGIAPGDRVALNLAWGIRPRRTEFRAPDLVLLLETNGRYEGRTRVDGRLRRASGGRVLTVAPAFLLSVRNVMLKGGVELPVWDDFNDPLRSADATVVAAIELHW